MRLGYGSPMEKPRLYEKRIKALARNVQNRRRELGFTQSDMMHLHGIDLRYYRRIEAGETNPTYKTLHHLACALECTIEDLVRLKQKKPKIIAEP